MMRHELEILRAGDEAADTLLLIHDINPISHRAPFIEGLARSRYIVAPSHPGFGASPLPTDFDTMYDLVNLYLDVLDNLDTDRIAIAGFGFGGWIAAELAVAGHRKLDRLVLVDALGLKLAASDGRDFPHLFNTDPAELLRLAWYDPAARPAGIHGIGWQATMSDEISDAELVRLARNWESLCLFAGQPHMFNPRLKLWLHRIRVPTLVLWGESDGIVTPEYGRLYADLIPGSIFETIRNAGHHPEIEQPAAFVASVVRFLS